MTSSTSTSTGPTVIALQVVPDRRRRWRRSQLAAVVAATAVSLVSCSGGEDNGPMPTFTSVPVPSSTAPVQVGEGEGLASEPYIALDPEVFPSTNSDDPQSVLVDGLQEAFAWRPAEDSNGWAAILRSHSAWNNQYLRDQEMRLTTLIPMSSRDWQSWGDRDQEFVAKVEITNEDHPEDTDTDFSRVTKIVLSTSGGTRPDLSREILTVIAGVRVHKTDLGWRIDSFDVRDSSLPEVTS